MKANLILTISFLTLLANGQIETLNNRVNNFSVSDTTIIKTTENDTIPLIEFYQVQNQKKETGMPVAYYINGKFRNFCLSTLDPKLIDSLRVEKKEIEIDGTKYYGQIYIQTKNNYTPKLISLNQLNEKYLNLKTERTIFQIDGNFILEDYNKYLVDEKYIYKIIVHKIKQKSERININIVYLRTKTTQNSKNIKTFELRN